jgi:hypothetical protein
VGDGFSRGFFIGIGSWFYASNDVQCRLDVQAPMTHLTSQSPGHEQTLAARVFHLDRRALTPRVFHPNHHSIGQALAPSVIHLNHYAIKQALAPKVFDLNRRDLAPRVFHLNHHVIGQALAPLASSAS